MTNLQAAPPPFPCLFPQGGGQVLHGDCLDVLRQLPAESIDLCYADPPFNTGRIMSAGAATYDDRWSDMDAYLAFMRPRLEQIARLLKPHGCILLHCDWRTCHHFRFMLDELLGPHSFVNHLIWRYGLGGSSSRRFARKHDDILFHAKGAEHYFDPPQVPATSNRMRGQTKKATDEIDVPSINNMAHERTGYPTQKPLALLEMLVQACCPRDGTVLDPFCGSGTTLVAAAKLDRRWLGIDVNEHAVRIARGRLS
jgi:DNA modification methylase